MMLELNPGLILWTLITFVILLFVLRTFAWKPLLHSLTSREEHIRGALDRADQARHEAEKLLEENRRQREQSEAEAQRMLSEGRAMGERLKTEIVEKAHQQSRKMIDQAKQEIEQSKLGALQELRSEVAHLAVVAAGKILGETLDENKHRKLIDDLLKNLPRN